MPSADRTMHLMTNIEVFIRVTAEIFRSLYSAFPVPIQISAEDVCKACKLSVEEFRDHPKGVPSNAVGCCIRWLGSEGFIRLTESEEGCLLFLVVVLSEKGLLALSKPLDALRPENGPMGRELVELKADSSSPVYAEAVTAIASAALGVGRA